MTLIADKPKRSSKHKLTIADRLMAARNRAIANVPKEDWNAIPKDASLKLEDYLEAKS
jgi:hypothetical protein